MLPPLDMEFLNFLIQPRNGLSLSFHRVEKLDGGELAEGLASRAGDQERSLPEPFPAARQVGRAAGKLASRSLWRLTSRWRS